MKFYVTSRSGIECGLDPGVPHVVISIRCPGSPKPKLPPLPSRVGLLSMAFSDIEPRAGIGLDDVRAFTDEDAECICRFIAGYPGISAIVVHCEAGMSRSPAIAAALAAHFGNMSAATMCIHNRTPNAHVLRTMQRVLQRQTPTVKITPTSQNKNVGGKRHDGNV